MFVANKVSETSIGLIERDTHQFCDLAFFKVLHSILFQEKSDLRSTAKSVAAWVREYIKRSIVCGGAEHILCRFWDLRGRGRDRCNGDAIRNKEATVES